MSDITGIIHLIKATQKITEKFSKRDIIIKDNSGQYPQYILLEAQKDKIELLDGHGVGDEIKIFYNLRGKLWTSPQGEEKCFNTLVLWKIEGISKAAASSPDDGSFKDSEFQENTYQGTPPDTSKNDDLPF